MSNAFSDAQANALKAIEAMPAANKADFDGRTINALERKGYIYISDAGDITTTEADICEYCAENVGADYLSHHDYSEMDLCLPCYREWDAIRIGREREWDAS